MSVSTLIYDDVKILHNANSNTSNFLLFLEALYIKFLSPSLNSCLKPAKSLRCFPNPFSNTSHCPEIRLSPTNSFVRRHVIIIVNYCIQNCVLYCNSSLSDDDFAIKSEYHISISPCFNRILHGFQDANFRIMFYPIVLKVQLLIGKKFICL